MHDYSIIGIPARLQWPLKLGFSSLVWQGLRWRVPMLAHVACIWQSPLLPLLTATCIHGNRPLRQSIRQKWQLTTACILTWSDHIWSYLIWSYSSMTLYPPVIAYAYVYVSLPVRFTIHEMAYLAWRIIWAVRDGEVFLLTTIAGNLCESCGIGLGADGKHYQCVAIWPYLKHIPAEIAVILGTSGSLRRSFW